jgi:hypothetical protein
MADIRTVPIIEDTGSEQLKRLTDSYNALLESLGTYMDTVEAAAGASAAAATAFLAEVETDTATVVAIGRLPGVQARPARAVTS